MSDGAPVDLSRYRARRVRTALVASLELLRGAIARRDLPAIWHLLDEPHARRAFPREVREEALEIAQLPSDVERVPVRLLRFQHTLVQLGDEPLSPAEEAPPADPPGEPGSPPRTLSFLRARRAGPVPRPPRHADTGERPRSS